MIRSNKDRRGGAPSRTVLVLSFVLALMAPLPIAAETPPPAAPDQRALIREVIIDLLREQPELVLEALQALETREQVQAQTRQSEALARLRPQLEQDADDLVTGNPAGDVTIVEFFDYRCPYCKQAQASLDQAVRADGRVRLVHKQFPILGPDSVVAARAVIAARQQNRQGELHKALMAVPGGLTEAEVFRQARSAGLDEARLRRDMASPAVDAVLRRSLEVGRALDLRGTPAFVVGSRLIPGAVDAATLGAAVAAARQR
ncbi:MAG: DsbA family protein [Alphaproteobacteria bacterium]|nr:DsbA family protein [Alphaproteobacteria bacterium]TAD91137.1 MAG: DsbA family protein [Alphaproteobacteria bacterium]